MSKVVDLEIYRQTKAGRKKASTQQVQSIFSWKNDEQLHSLTQSRLVRALVIEVLESLNVNPAMPQHAAPGMRTSITIDEKAMRREGLDRNDVFRNVRDTIWHRTARIPEQNFVYPRTPDEQLQISLYLP